MKMMILALITVSLLLAVNIGSAVDMPPELVIGWDPEAEEIVISGVDDIDEDVDVTETRDWWTGNTNHIIYHLEDNSGNTLDAWVTHQLNDENDPMVKVRKVNYNGDGWQTTSYNPYTVDVRNFGGKKMVIITFDTGSDEIKSTTIYKLEKTFITHDGDPNNYADILFPQMLTNQGNLDYNIPI